MAKDLNDIFCYERGNNLIEARRNEQTDRVRKVSLEIATDLAEFVAARKWNNIDLQIDVSRVAFKGDTGLPILEIGIRHAGEVETSMEVMDAISDVEDLIDAAIHEIEDFDSIYVSLVPPE